MCCLETPKNVKGTTNRTEAVQLGPRLYYNARGVAGSNWSRFQTSHIRIINQNNMNNAVKPGISRCTKGRIGAIELSSQEFALAFMQAIETKM
jgi:hypothetical protein